MRTTARLLLTASAVVALGACAPVTEQTGRNASTRPRTQLVVENNNWLDVVVYLVRGSARTRLGTVSSMTTGKLTIPDAYVIGVSDVTVQADPIGATNTYTSPPIQVFPGATLSLRVGGNVKMSDFAVYRTGTK